MDGSLGIFALVCLSVVTAELVYLDDTNFDHEKRNLDFGLPENLMFRMKFKGDDVNLNLRENRRLNANAPIYELQFDEENNMRAVKSENIQPNNKVRYYQDVANGAFMTVECKKNPNGPCTRLLTGNLVLNGQEHKLEPAMDMMARRELPSHLGTPHMIEALDNPFEIRGVSEHPEGGRVVTAHKRDEELMDYVTHGPDTTYSSSTYSTTTEDLDARETDVELAEGLRESNKLLIEKLLHKLNRQKRTPVAHGIEMLLAIDHLIYNEFATRYSGDETIKYKIREYYAHLVNGVDLRYASIQEEDISIYVIIKGFVISNATATSPWLNYDENPTNGYDGLSYMRTWRQTAGLPDHDHAAFLTGSDIRGSSSGVVGIAYLNGVCNSYRVSINEEYGMFKGSGVLAHELGHNLGAYHDSGETGSGCNRYDDYVMAPVVPSVSSGSTHLEPWRFSTCSIDYFRGYFASLSNDCTLIRGDVWDQDEYDKHLAGLAGQLYSEEEQCELLRGDGSTILGSNKNTADICRNMRCTDPNNPNSYRRYVAAHGTPCGNNLMCFEGLCQEEPDLGPQYVCEDTGVAGKNCTELQTLMGTPKKMCNVFFRECCAHCYAENVCKKDKKIKGAGKWTCAQLVNQQGLTPVETCRLFPLECCNTCGSIRT